MQIEKATVGVGVLIEGGQEKVSGYVNGKFIFCTEVHSLNPLCQHPPIRPSNRSSLSHYSDPRFASLNEDACVRVFSERPGWRMVANWDGQRKWLDFYFIFST